MVEKLYNTFEKAGCQYFVQECICSNCASEVNNDVNSKVYAKLDVYATNCWSEDEEICAICSRDIDRTDSD